MSHRGEGMGKGNQVVPLPSKFFPPQTMKRIVRPVGAPRHFFYVPKPDANHVTLQNYAAGTIAILTIDNCIFPFEIRRTSDEAPIHIIETPKLILAFKTHDTQDAWAIFLEADAFGS